MVQRYELVSENTKNLGYLYVLCYLCELIR